MLAQGRIEKTHVSIHLTITFHTTFPTASPLFFFVVAPPHFFFLVVAPPFLLVVAPPFSFFFGVVAPLFFLGLWRFFFGALYFFWLWQEKTKNSEIKIKQKSKKSKKDKAKKTIPKIKKKKKKRLKSLCTSTALYSSSPRNRSTSSIVCKAGALVPSPPCLGEVPVDTHSTPMLTSVRRLWVAYVLYEPNEPQEHAQPAHGSGARVQDHDPETNQPASPDDSTVEPLAQVMVAAEQIPSQSAAQQLSRSPPERTSSDGDESSTPSMEQSEEAAPATPVSKVLKRCWRMPRWSHPRQGGHSGRVAEPRGSYPRHTGERSGERRSHRNQASSASRIDTSQELQR